MRAQIFGNRPAVFAVILALPLFLGGCGIDEALNAMEREEFERSCANLGISKGTQSWDMCMIQQQASARNEEQQFLNRARQSESVRELNRRR